MKALVVYDSFFGNTEKIAQAIGQGLGSQGEVEARRVGEVTPWQKPPGLAPQQLAGVQLLIVGSPTRGFRASEATMKFLNSIPAGGLRGVKVAAFDTRMSLKDLNNAILNFVFWLKLGGYAAKPIANALQKSGGELLAAPEGFFVKASEGPLHDGELERAAEWGRKIRDVKRET